MSFFVAVVPPDVGNPWGYNYLFAFLHGSLLSASATAHRASYDFKPLLLYRMEMGTGHALLGFEEEIERQQFSTCLPCSITEYDASSHGRIFDDVTRFGHDLPLSSPGSEDLRWIRRTQLAHRDQA